MPAIHFFGGEKGGVGKSFICRAAIAYHRNHDIDFVPFDTDRSNPDVMRIYGKIAGCKTDVFSEGVRYEDTANHVFNVATEKRVLVNLPAQSFISLRGWIEKNELLDLAEENGIDFYIWFVSDCGYDSLKLLNKSVSYFQDRVQHILVANYGMTEDWEPLERDAALQKLLKKYGVKVIEFPKFIGNSDRNRIDSLSLSFEVATEHEEFGLISRQRVKTFLRKAFAAFDEVGVF